jgi:cobalt-zinc-cadmium efflux system membrane fusion protein
VVRAPALLFQAGLLKMGKVERRAVAAPLELTGEVHFDERRVAHLSTQAEGIVRKAHVTLGDRVRRGQPLVEIESVAAGEAQAALLEAQGLQALARRNFERTSALRREGIASQKEFLASKQELDAAEIRVQSAAGKLARLGMAAGGSTGRYRASATGRLTLRAPINGTVLDMHAVPGEVAKADESLLTVGDNADVWVWADVYERDIAAITRAQARQALAASVEVRAYPGEEIPGTVDFVSPAMSKGSRTVRLRVAVPNRAGRLLAGMFARVKIFLPAGEQALVVPRQAVLEDEGRSFVFVPVRDDYFVRRPVQLGRAFAGLVELRRGPPEGSAVVTEGAFLMKSDVLRSKMGAGCAD